MTKYIGENNYEHGSVERTGILLTNLGTPDEPNSKAVKRYLAEFLSDTRVIEFPKFFGTSPKKQLKPNIFGNKSEIFVNELKH